MATATTGTAHPTREEWEARRASLPPAVREWVDRRLARVGAVRAAERAAQDARRDAKAEEMLRRVGASWLWQYRDRRHDTALTVYFDPTAAGLWPIRANTGWGGGGGAPWVVDLPTGAAPYGDWSDALAAAAEYVGTPF